MLERKKEKKRHSYKEAQRMGGLDIVIPLRSRSAETDYGQLTPSAQSNNLASSTRR